MAEIHDPNAKIYQLYFEQCDIGKRIGSKNFCCLLVKNYFFLTFYQFDLLFILILQSLGLGSKKKIIWRFIVGENSEEHEVILIHSLVSGKKIITFDAEEVVNSQIVSQVDNQRRIEDIYEY